MTRSTHKDYEPIDEVMLKKVLNIAEFFYGILTDFPDEEKWNTVSKVRAANDLLYFVAQATGNATPSSREYDWGNVRKQTVALKTLYRFAHKQNFVKVDPTIMLQLDAVLEYVETELQRAYAQTKENTEREKRLWHDRYEIWKETEEGFKK